MSALQSDSIVGGTSYVMWLKNADNHKCEDAYYALVHQGNSRFNYLDFDFVCKVANNKFSSLTKSRMVRLTVPGMSVCKR